jgi:hypothetical protein
MRRVPLVVVVKAWVFRLDTANGENFEWPIYAFGENHLTCDSLFVSIMSYFSAILPRPAAKMGELPEILIMILGLSRRTTELLMLRFDAKKEGYERLPNHSFMSGRLIIEDDGSIQIGHGIVAQQRQIRLI